MSAGNDALDALLRPAVESLGYEFVGIEYRGGQRGALLRIYIDTPDGVTLDDCQKVSYHVSGVLDVEDPVRGRYTLEVSSPGLDRLLFGSADYERFAGREIKLKLAVPAAGKRNLTGLLKGIDGNQVMVEVAGEILSLPLSDIDKARLVPE